MKRKLEADLPAKSNRHGHKLLSYVFLALTKQFEFPSELAHLINFLMWWSGMSVNIFGSKGGILDDGKFFCGTGPHYANACVMAHQKNILVCHDRDVQGFDENGNFKFRFFEHRKFDQVEISSATIDSSTGHLLLTTNCDSLRLVEYEGGINILKKISLKTGAFRYHLAYHPLNQRIYISDRFEHRIRVVGMAHYL